jgi:hypothetical protein
MELKKKKEFGSYVFKGFISRFENGLKLVQGIEAPGRTREGDAKLVR